MAIDNESGTWAATEAALVSQGKSRRQVFEQVSEEYGVSIGRVYNVLGKKYLASEKLVEYAGEYATRFRRHWTAARSLGDLPAERWLEVVPQNYGWGTLGELLLFSSTIHPSDWLYERLPHDLDPTLRLLWLRDHPEDTYDARVKEVARQLRTAGHML